MSSRKTKHINQVLLIMIIKKKEAKVDENRIEEDKNTFLFTTNQ